MENGFYGFPGGAVPPGAGGGVTPAYVRVVKTANDDTLTSTTSQTDLLHLSLSITIAAGSNIRVRTYLSPISTLSGGTVRFWVKLVSAAPATTYTALRDANFYAAGGNIVVGYGDEIVIPNPGAGTYTVSLAYQLGAAGTLYLRTSTYSQESGTLIAEEIPTGH